MTYRSKLIWYPNFKNWDGQLLSTFWKDPDKPQMAESSVAHATTNSSQWENTEECELQCSEVRDTLIKITN